MESSKPQYEQVGGMRNVQPYIPCCVEDLYNSDLQRDFHGKPSEMYMLQFQYSLEFW